MPVILLITTGGVGSDVVCGVLVVVCAGSCVGASSGVACFVIGTCAVNATAVVGALGDGTDGGDVCTCASGFTGWC